MDENIKEKPIDINKPARLIKKEPWQENPNEWISVTITKEQLAKTLHQVKNDNNKAAQFWVKLPRPMVPLNIAPQSGPEHPEYKAEAESPIV